MSDTQLLAERLSSVLQALERIPRRFAEIKSPSDFTDTDAGIDRMDAICMILIAVGEELKAIDRKTEGILLSRYSDINWRGIIGVRDFLAHGYFQVNAEQLFGICKDDIPALISTIREMIGELS
ncbi:MAG: DUF86 domain-containing protein [Armatimonadota bacterium]|nr:DUF86 domain-containing protein [Armatimonadota bacterium]